MYATVEQANTYIKTHYSSTDSLRLSWENLSDEDKEILLTRAEQQIDCLPLKGKPLVAGKAFPRDPFREVSLEKALVATVELAVQKQDKELLERYKLRSQGVRAYKIGDLSETLAASSTDGEVALNASILKNYLFEWFGGGYNICPTRF